MGRSHRRATAATATATAPRWLTAAQLAAWQALTLLLARLPTALDAQLQRDAQLSYVEYYVLAGLSEQPDHTMRISELAGFTNAELSRLSHLITRLQKRGHVRREPDPNDGRCTNAVLTAAGYNHLVAGAPGHVATVLELVIDALDDTALSALQDSAEHITARIDARHSAERRSAMSSMSQQTAIDEPEGLDQH
jgi:DNA-binding MarR family transcriptional regulator